METYTKQELRPATYKDTLLIKPKSVNKALIVKYVFFKLIDSIFVVFTPKLYTKLY